MLERFLSQSAALLRALCRPLQGCNCTDCHTLDVLSGWEGSDIYHIVALDESTAHIPLLLRNSEGHPVVLGKDGITHYCGMSVGTRGYWQLCNGLCDGQCGCVAFFLLYVLYIHHSL